MQNRRTPTFWTWLALVGQLGISMIVPIVFCTMTAFWLDQRYHLGGWVVIVGIFIGLLGAAVSFMKVVRLIQRATQKQEDDDA